MTEPIQAYFAHTPVEIFVAAFSFIVIGISVFIVRKCLQGVTCHCLARLDGQTAIITGASDGIGKQVALDLARRGCAVVMASYNHAKAERAAAEVRCLSNNQDVTAKHIDLASMASVRMFAAEMHMTARKVNILINNAGMGGIPRTLTQDGHEMTFAVNHLGPFLLTNLLLDLLKSSTPSRVITVSSRAHEVNAMEFDDLMSEKSYNYLSVYGQSKLANILFTRELARRVKGTGVSVCCLHPGTVATNLTRSLPQPARAIVNCLLRVFAKSPQQGAQTSIHCAISAQLAEHSGSYFSDCRPVMPSAAAMDDEAARRLWQISEELTGLSQQNTLGCHPITQEVKTHDCCLATENRCATLG